MNLKVKTVVNLIDNAFNHNKDHNELRGYTIEPQHWINCYVWHIYDNTSGRKIHLITFTSSWWRVDIEVNENELDNWDEIKKDFERSMKEIFDREQVKISGLQ